MTLANPAEALVDGVAHRCGMAGESWREAHDPVVHTASAARTNGDRRSEAPVVLRVNQR